MSKHKESAPALSILTFWWLRDAFRLGFQRTLTLSDLPHPPAKFSAESLTNKLEQSWFRESPGKHRLVRAISKTFRRDFAVVLLVTLFHDFVVRLFTPLLLKVVLRFFSKSGNDTTSTQAGLCALGIVLLSVCGSFSFSHTTYTSCLNGNQIGTAVRGLVYRKSLRMSKSATSSSPGHVLNLISNDTSRIVLGSGLVNWTISGPLFTAAVSLILVHQVGWFPLIGVGIILILVPIQCLLGTWAAKIQLKTTQETDVRLGLVSELIAGIQMIKFFAWEKWIRSRVLEIRRKELLLIQRSGFLRGIYMTLSVFGRRLMLWSTVFVMSSLAPSSVTASSIFMIAAYYNVLGHSMGQMFVRSVSEVAAALVSVKRIEAFLDLPEIEALPVAKEFPEIYIKNATAFWKKELEVVNTQSMLLYKKQPPTLKGISLRIPQGHKLLVGVIGSVGSGKTSLLELILGELPEDEHLQEKGSVFVSGTTSLCSQEPWFFDGSVKENILFNAPFDEERYHQVVTVCTLNEDLQHWPLGHETLVGERGNLLSGGQKARLNLARAIYRDADIYLLDDPLSAVDAHVGRFLFDNVIGPRGFLSNSVRLLITHQMEYLQEVDWVVVMKEGMIELQGTPQEVLREELQLEHSPQDQLPEELSNVKQVFRKKEQTEEKQKLLEKLPPNAQSKTALNSPPKLEKEKPSSAFKQFQLIRYLLIGGFPVLLCMFILFTVTQFACSASDVLVTNWIRELKQNNGRSNESINLTVTDTSPIDPNHEEHQQLNSGTSLVSIATTLLSSILFLGTLRAFFFQWNVTRTSAKLHERMLDAILGTSLRFFEANPCGRILNKFSKDLSQADVQLPKLLLDALQFLLIIVGALCVVLVMNPLFILPVVLLFLIFSVIRRLYLKFSIQVTRLEASTRSPIYTHLSNTLAGLSVVRSSEAAQKMSRRFEHLQDLNTPTWFAYHSCNGAFGVVLELLSTVFIGVVLLFFFLIPSSAADEVVGLAITQALTLSNLLTWGLRQSVAVANALVSVERVLEYDQLPREEDETSSSLSSSGEKAPQLPISSPNVFGRTTKEWPNEGQIEFINVNYHIGSQQCLLRDVNLRICGRQKLGVVGRTGAGKSSLISALFRLFALDAGSSIQIDGVPISGVSLAKLRSRISIIPQDPFLFRGTIATNLDPNAEFAAEELREALGDVGMRHLSLAHPVRAGGSDFSVGQRQLICLARALLRRNRILIMDEATSNLDPITDELIQKTVRRRFRNCTVIAVAHRIETVRDADWVIVMDQGRICDQGEPSLIIPRL